MKSGWRRVGHAVNALGAENLISQHRRKAMAGDLELMPNFVIGVETDHV